MSRYDFQIYGAKVRELLYKSLTPTLAASSVKLGLYRIGSTHQPYIWADPPWLLYHGHDLAIDPRTYPRDPIRYPNKERQWFKEGSVFTRRKHVLLSVHRSYDGVVRLSFNSDWVLLLPGHERARDSSSYDDWYANVQSAA